MRVNWGYEHCYIMKILRYFFKQTKRTKIGNEYCISLTLLQQKLATNQKLMHTIITSFCCKTWMRTLNSIIHVKMFVFQKCAISISRKWNWNYNLNSNQLFYKWLQRNVCELLQLMEFLCILSSNAALKQTKSQLDNGFPSNPTL